MDNYLLTLLVSLEQELAIRQLFVFRGWDFRKQDANYFAVSKVDGSCTSGVGEVAESLPKSSKLEESYPINENKTTTNVLDTEIFSDLEDLVEATLDATSDTDIPSYSGLNTESGIMEESFKDKIEANFDNGKGVLEVEGGQTVTVTCTKTALKSSRECLEDAILTERKSEHQPINRPRERMKQKRQNESIQQKQSGQYYCDECKYTFKKLCHFKNHKKNGRCFFVCKYCGKEFTFRIYSNYLRHLKYHENDKQFKCTECGKMFVEEHVLKSHMRKHTGERPYVCDSCGKAFHTSSNLICHRQYHHQQSADVHKCEICDQILCSAGGLREHKRVVHTGDRPFTCETCGQRFKTKKALKCHDRVHRDEFPYICDFQGCDKRFKSPEGLKQHVQRHNKARTHFCDQCGKGFYGSKDLKQHFRIHTGEKPFACEQCEYKCTMSGNLRKHMKTHQTI